MDWKKTMATDQTDGEPPSLGSTMRANIGCTANKSSALTNTAAVNAARMTAGRVVSAWDRCSTGEILSFRVGAAVGGSSKKAALAE
jgi:hypothetical protein